jgi:hypothetical protein
MAFEYDLASKRYRDRESGQYISTQRTREIREEFLAARKEQVISLGDQLGSGDLSLADWERAVRQEIKATHVGVAALGGGGRNAMTDADWGHLGPQLRAQYGFLRAFAEEVGRGELSVAQVKARSAHYLDSGAQGFERARASRFNVSLPVYPGDGGTPCHGRCHCHWSLVETEEGVEATWQTTGSGSTCSGCQDRASLYAPLVVERAGEGERLEQPVPTNGKQPVAVGEQ